MCRKAVVVIDEAHGGSGVDFDGIAVGLPVRGEDHDGFGFDLLCDLAADLFELEVGGVFGVFEDVGTAWESMSD